MPKVKISEYSATANSNTDVASINIDEGCAPSGINNAIRAVMGHLKDFQQGTNGDPFNGPVNGTLGATTASTAVVTTLNSTDATDASSTTAAAMKTAGGLGVAKKMFVGLDANIYGLTVGRGAGAVATNTAVGASALSTNSTGGLTTAVGFEAAKVSTAGDLDAFGYQSLKANTTGTANAAFGTIALSANTTGIANVAAGRAALNVNTTGSYNTAIGRSALEANTTANNSTAIGYQSLYASNRTADAGANNTAVGSQAGLATTTGAKNTFLGVYAGYSNTTGASNTFVGAQSASTGYGCGELMTTGSKNTIIGGFSGNQGGLDIRTASNYIVLSDGDGNPRGYNTATQWIFSGATKTAEYFWSAGVGTAGGLYLGSAGSANGLISQGSGGTGTTTTYIGNAAITTVSDVRLKENIVDTQRNALNILNQLRVVDHTWNDPSDQCENNRNSRGTWMGLIAQEAQPVIPWLVNKPTADVDENGDPQYWHMDYGYAVPLLVKAIQELKAEVDSLKAQINGASA
jgi:hypothetical protein